MTTQEERDLSLLGLGHASSSGEVRAAYRTLVKRLHPDVCPGDAGAGERLARVNAAYARLSARRPAPRYPRWSPETVFAKARAAQRPARRAAPEAANRPREPRAEAPRPAPRHDAAPDAALRATLDTFLERKRGQEAFYRMQERRGGVYSDPRRRLDLAGVDLPGFATLRRVERDGTTLRLHVDGACKLGRNLLILPEIGVGADGSVTFGPAARSFEFSCSRATGRIVRLHARQQPVAGADGLVVEVHYPRTEATTQRRCA